MEPMRFSLRLVLFAFVVLGPSAAAHADPVPGEYRGAGERDDADRDVRNHRDAPPIERGERGSPHPDGQTPADSADPERESAGPTAAAAGSGRASGRDSSTWYGWQILLADAVTWATLLSEPTAYFSPALYLGAGPLLHLGNGNGRGALGSVATRSAGASVATFGLMIALFGEAPRVGIPIMVGGTVLPTVVDVAVLGRTEPERDPHTRRALAPTAGFTRGGFQLGLTGRF